MMKKSITEPCNFNWFQVFQKKLSAVASGFAHFQVNRGILE